jgi:hypothetical protein
MTKIPKRVLSVCCDTTKAQDPRKNPSNITSEQKKQHNISFLLFNHFTKMQLFFILCLSLLLAAARSMDMMPFGFTIYDADATSACSDSDFSTLFATIEDSITFWANEYLSSIGAVEDFEITALEPVGSGSRMLLNEQEQQKEARQQAKEGASIRNLAPITYSYKSVFSGKGSYGCKLCTVDNSDKRSVRRLASVWKAERLVSRINSKLTKDVREYIKASATNRACFKSAQAFSAYFELK